MKYVLIVLFTFNAWITSNAQNTQSDIDKIKGRLFELSKNKQHRSELNTTTPLDSIALLFNNETGTWVDIDYADNTRSRWQPAEHWRRTYELAVALNSTHKGNNTFETIIGKAVHYWVGAEPRCTNWWWNDIGIPLYMGKTLVLCDAKIIAPTYRDSLAVLMSGSLGKGSNYYGDRTGQNLMWLTTIHIHIGVEQNDPTALQQAFKAIKSEIRLTTDEGIQYDFSFHQHGAQLYNLGYGRSFGLYIAQLAHLASGTQFGFSPEKLAIISNYTLQGQQWLMYKNQMDFNAMGRTFTRADITSEPILWSAQTMKKADPQRSEEYDIFIKDYLSGTHSIAFTGNKHFWHSDIMVHRKPKFYSSIKMASYRTKWTETINQENLKGYYMGNGIQCIMRHGDEYDAVFPLWDWKKLPGHLSEQDSASLPILEGSVGADNTTVFVGGVSNGTQGLAANDYEKHGMQAKRAWFFFDDEIVHLLSGITYEGTNPLYQSVNQCNGIGDVFYEDNNKQRKVKLGKDLHTNTSWVWHDSIAYYFLDNYPIHTSIETRKGNWKEINSTFDIPIEREVFSLGIEIPSSVKPSDSFAYVIKPNVTVQEAPTAIDNITVIANNKNQQVVFNKSLNQYQIAFYQPDKLLLSEDLWIEIDRPGLLIFSLQSEKEIQVSVANPLNRKAVYTIKTNLPLQGENCNYNKNLKATTITLDNKSKPYSGETVSANYTVLK